MENVLTFLLFPYSVKYLLKCLKYHSNSEEVHFTHGGTLSLAFFFSLRFKIYSKKKINSFYLFVYSVPFVCSIGAPCTMCLHT